MTELRLLLSKARSATSHQEKTRWLHEMMIARVWLLQSPKQAAALDRRITT